MRALLAIVFVWGVLGCSNHHGPEKDEGDSVGISAWSCRINNFNAIELKTIAFVQEYIDGFEGTYLLSELQVFGYTHENWPKSPEVFHSFAIKAKPGSTAQAWMAELVRGCGGHTSNFRSEYFDLRVRVPVAIRRTDGGIVRFVEARSKFQVTATSEDFRYEFQETDPSYWLLSRALGADRERIRLLRGDSPHEFHLYFHDRLKRDSSSSRKYPYETETIYRATYRLQR